MTRYLKTVTLLAFTMLLCISCEEDAELTTLQEVSFASPIQATPESIILSDANAYQPVLNVSWMDVQFPIEAPVTYTLAIDVAADTFGENGWANAERFVVGEDVLSTSFVGGDLNDIAADLGLESDVEGELVLRVEAYMDRYVYSEPVTIAVTPYTQEVAFGQIYMPGSYQGWDPATAAVLPAIATGVYQGYITILAPQGLGFKFTPEPNWDTFYGLDTNGNFAQGGDTDLTLPNYGSFQITVNLNTMTYTFTPYSWGIIGPSTPGGWDSDTDMFYDYANFQWKYTGPLNPGALKFRLNDMWPTNYGTEDGNNGEITNGTMYLDNPGAHTINTAGNYEVTFVVDPNNPATATYSVTEL